MLLFQLLVALQRELLLLIWGLWHWEADCWSITGYYFFERRAQLVCTPPNLKEKGLYGSKKNHKNCGSLHSFPYTPKILIEWSKKKSVLVTEEKLLPWSKVGIALFMLADNVLYSSWTAILAFSSWCLCETVSQVDNRVYWLHIY